MAAVLCVSLLAAGAAAASVSSDGLWQDVSEQAALAAGTGERMLFPRAYRVVELNVEAFQDLARSAPLELTYGVEDLSPVITLPMPDGRFARFRMQETVVMDAQLAARLPEVKTYRAQGIDDPTATARLDFTPLGFHGFIRSEKGAIYIDPFLRGDTNYYISYWRRDYTRGENHVPFTCEFAAHNEERAKTRPRTVTTESKRKVASLVAHGDTLRTYRLALAATGEYTSFHGGTVAGAQAAMATTMNRVNGIYEADVAVRLIMIDNTNMVFTNAGTDPFDNTWEDINILQSEIDDLAGNANYDIGHLFGTGGGGIAGLGVVCSPWKAEGLTGSSSPINDAYDVDYVAHEIGHQFGGNHTYNGRTSSCNGQRESTAAFEPGSGSTIMAYAGICGAENLQPNSDPYFHTHSFDEIVTFILNDGDDCPVKTATGNDAPAVDAGPAITIPRQTPFYLTGSATDPNGDPLTYGWEQYNLGSVSPPNNDTTALRPIFRSFNPTTSPVRTFPKLSDLLNNVTTIGEALPTKTWNSAVPLSQTMLFRLTARDNKAGGGGSNYDTASVIVTDTAGPFTVTAPNTTVNWAAGSMQTVTWNVANTTAAPVSCANVKILLSTDGGTTFPTTILASTANDGTEAITLPNAPTTTARIRVECATSPFFDISNFNFTIAESMLVVATATSATSVDITWNAIAGAVSYEIHRKPAGGSFSLVGTNATPNFTDNTATANNAYLYAVKWVNSSSVASALSAADLATTFVFTDPTLTPLSSIVKAVHIVELRSAIALVRNLAGLGAFSYTDPTLTAGSTRIKAVHLTELRTALEAARTALALPTLTYTDPTLTVGSTKIKTAHITELRSGVN